MKTIITPVKLTPEEREVLINISADENGKFWAEIDTTIQKYANKCIKQGWNRLQRQDILMVVGKVLHSMRQQQLSVSVILMQKELCLTRRSKLWLKE